RGRNGPRPAHLEEAPHRPPPAPGSPARTRRAGPRPAPPDSRPPGNTGGRTRSRRSASPGRVLARRLRTRRHPRDRPGRFGGRSPRRGGATPGRVRPTCRPPRDSPPTRRTAAPGPRHGGGPGRTTDPVPPGHPSRPGLPAYRNHHAPARTLSNPPPGQVRRDPSLTPPIAPHQKDVSLVGCRLG